MRTELLGAVHFMQKELRELYKSPSGYFQDIWWNINDVITPVSFIIGFAFDDQEEMCMLSRVSYAITTMSLLFVFLQGLRLTERFSFIVSCIISSFSQLKDYITFFFLLVTFLTVSYNCLGYRAPYEDKMLPYLAIFINMFKSAMGESQTDEILELVGAPYYFGWFLYMFLAFFTTIIFMNILIAVISD